MERLQKILSRAGVASRREAEKIILAGRVSVDGEIVTELGRQFSPDSTILVDGKRIETESKVYFLLNKPRGYLSTSKDDRGRKIILDLFPEKTRQSYRLFSIGRLDYDTEGLLIVTNDGELTNRLIHPRFEIEKVYRAEILGTITVEKIRKLETGIELDDGLTAPARVKKISEDVLEIAIHEGKNRQVRRMLAAVGLEVESLRRIKFAGLFLDVAVGKYRALTKLEIEKLYSMTS